MCKGLNDVHCFALKNVTYLISSVDWKPLLSRRGRFSFVMAWDVVLCVVCRVWAVIWLKCVRNVIWDHLIYFIHWQPIWPECDPAISTGAPRSLPASHWSGVALLASDWLAGLTRSLTILEAQFTRALGREQHCAALYDPGHVRQSTQTRGGIPEVPAPNIPLMRLSLRLCEEL